ncbi:response regulator [Paraburkholderia rhizosphaerae]|uniref:Response regulator receiver domain-containing protein n=1 Tax=Paraburkholderia rhizosphaerae TaxID=480658 RepID=A0A4V3HEK7_9BURK|nr:response regulator [Paraburkholderia rhizosphaerae]TDY48189.1 response regulator receiver domain-containing protein [Paraburkholderia rhizosphaerae]
MRQASAEFSALKAVLHMRPFQTARWTPRVLSQRQADCRRRLLVVDDYRPGAEAITASLYLSGYEAQFVLSGMAVIHAINGWTPDIAILDINMPGMDGFEVARQLRRHRQTQHIVIVAFTAQDEYVLRHPVIDRGGSNRIRRRCLRVGAGRQSAQRPAQSVDGLVARPGQGAASAGTGDPSIVPRAGHRTCRRRCGWNAGRKLARGADGGRCRHVAATDAVYGTPDHHYLADDAPSYLGTISFALCAMTAHSLGFVSISLIAGGGRGFIPDMIGYRYWPKVGFDAVLLEGETAGAAHLADCRTVQDVLARDPAWWERNGSQRLMEFDLGEGSPSWEKLLDYLREKELV